MRVATALLCPLALVVPGVAARAGAPYCAIEESCTVTSDNCKPAEGRIEMRLQPGGKALVLHDGTEMGSASVLGLNGLTVLIFTNDAGVQNQLRIEADGRFNYLISRPDETAPKGKDQILYRGQCVEGEE